MTKDNKPLADVQPGGRVRLGDVLPPLPKMQRFTNLYGETYAYSAEQMRDYARAALSAQPSPGGQGDAVRCGKCKDRGYVDVDVDVDDSGSSIGNVEACPHCALSAQPSPGGQGDIKARFTEWVKANSYNPATFASGRFMGDGVQIAWEAVQALAARQPVYEGHTWISDYVLAGLRERAALPLQLRNGEVWHWQGDGHDFPESLVCPVIMSAETLRALLAARQPVGEPVGYATYRDGRFGSWLFQTRAMAESHDSTAVAGGPANSEIVPLFRSPAPAVDLGDFKALYRAYVRLLESGRDRIRDLGGACDPVDVMEANDVDLQAARRVIDSKAVGK